MLDAHQVATTDLVLRVSEAVNPETIDIARYSDFIDALCGDRDYQKRAIETAVRYVAAGEYQTLDELLAENFSTRASLEEVYGDLPTMRSRALFVDKLAASIDLATGTGKSYVIYAVATILLAEGIVDRVLVLCPSLTIEAGLREKFLELAGSEPLRAMMPAESLFASPSIVTGSETILPGCLCVENYHATLEKSRTSLRPTLSGNGAKTLVLNDECHHLRSGSSDVKRWTEFVASKEFGFHYVLGFSGTCYQSDDYFSDVIYRYSLRQAIEDGYVKTVDYVAEDSSSNRDEKFQKIYDNHIYNRDQKYRLVKPLTLIITRDISACKRVTRDLIEFISKKEGLPEEEVGRKVLAVTSDSEHRLNLLRIASVDSAQDPVEWITSVSMLTEGWDVKNVFQVVPHEERAFSSKLLIAQVLGRGLRIPSEYASARPALTVFNHDSWSARIKHLVEEILEIDTRLISQPIAKTPDYNFDIENINYTRRPETETFEQDQEYEFSKGWISLASQVREIERETVYERILRGDHRTKTTRISFQLHSLEDVVEHVHSKFKAIDLEQGTGYSSTYTTDWIRKLIRESLRRVGETDDVVSEENRQRILASFGVIHRSQAKAVRYVAEAQNVFTRRTDTRPKDSVSVAALRRGEVTVFFDENSTSSSVSAAEAHNAQSVIDDDTLPRSGVEEVPNKYNFKTPLSCVFADHKPERLFVRSLIKPENASAITGWVKSTDQGFYPIEYAYRRGTKLTRSTFNPDFFILAGARIYSIEIKEDNEIQAASAENRAKARAAMAHFDLLNEKLGTRKYEFHFLTPQDFDAFFLFLREGRSGYASAMDAALIAHDEG
ncbi:hypothetical protein LK10_12895 [Sinomonas humi]|uniref:Helicase/UvrB N-terminal domain-containing protein n=2 Tax=Sinomonas humi TaxID=1338436 RepID=A0A0B2AKG9_9MICC|nr:hypothetical protein LK10_12895 [Sinomonas humi]